MERIRLGRTGIEVCSTGFGALPIQRAGREEAVSLLQRAADGGIDFFDTARGYSDSEEKLGLAFAGRRDSVVIATKSHGGDRETLMKHCEESLRMLQTDYIDLYQLHNPSAVPLAGSELYEGMLDLRRAGKIRFIGITCHRLENALQAARSGLYDTVQFPLSYLSDEKDLELVRVCREQGVGFIAMKALSGGLIGSAAAAFAFLRAQGSVLPIWGIQREEELDEFLALTRNPPELTGELQTIVDRDRKELSGTFCRGCGYCMPCPAGIPIFMAARMSLLLRRAPYRQFVTEQWQQEMEKVEGCTGCGHCRRHCPYGLDAPELLKANLKDYREFVRDHAE